MLGNLCPLVPCMPSAQAVVLVYSLTPGPGAMYLLHLHAMTKGPFGTALALVRIEKQFFLL